MHEGTHACYSHGCREAACTAAHAAYERDAARRRRRPDSDWQPADRVDAGEVREHLLFLAARGVGLRQIERATGVHRATLHLIRNGTRKTCGRAAAKKVLGLGLHRVRPRVDAGATRSLLLRFAEANVGLRLVSIATGVTRTTLHEIRSGTVDTCYLDTAEKIAAVTVTSIAPRYRTRRPA